jgi:type IV pilus assembly protein PilM
MLFPTKRKVSIVFQDHVLRLIDSSKPDLSSVRFLCQRRLPEDIILEGKIRDHDTLKLILEEMVAEGKLKGQKVAFLVPDSLVVVRKVQIPLDIQESEMKGYIFLEIGSSIHLPFDNPVFDIHVIEETDQVRNVLVYAAPEEIVQEYAEILETVKLRPTAVDLSPFAIYRLYHKSEKAHPEDHLLCVEFNIQTVNLSIFKGDELVFMRHIRMNMDLDAWKVKRADGGQEELAWSGSEEHLLGEMQDMLSEVERIMNFYRFSLNLGKEQITRILLTGDHPNLASFQERLMNLTDIPLDTFSQPFFTVKGERIPVSYHLCLGLSLKEVE